MKQCLEKPLILIGWRQTMDLSTQADQSTGFGAKGKQVCIFIFYNAGLMLDGFRGRSARGILHMINQMPIDWFRKRQNQVELATNGSKFMVAWQATEQLIDLQYTFPSFGVPLDGAAWLFGDNQSVVTTSTIPHLTLRKRRNALSYHPVQEAVASGWLRTENQSSGYFNRASTMAQTEHVC